MGAFRDERDRNGPAAHREGRMSASGDAMNRDSTNPFVVWGRLLLDDPGSGLDDLLSGRGARGAQQRAEPEDFLADLLARPVWAGAARERLIRRLDGALLNWIKKRFEWSLSDIGAFGTRAYAAQMSDALTVAARLPLTNTARDLIHDQTIWDNRFRGLRWPGDIDLLRQFNLVLARHQSDARFVSRWFTTCDDAAWGSPHWRTDLNTGLLGLRKLPETAGTEPESRVAAALARFGALALDRGMNSREVETTIRRRAAALTVLYPRHEGHWQDVWGRVLEDLPSSMPKEASATLARWLGHVPTRRGAGDVRPPGDRQRVADRVAVHQALLPDVENRRLIEDKIETAQFLDDRLWEETRALIRAHWLHASVSGKTYFAVRTTHNLYDRILRLRPARACLADMHVRALQAIEAEPGNPYIWDLWAKVLSALGRNEASLSVRWESARRFPEDCVLRNSLAETLWKYSRIPVAEHLLRETMRDFPNNEVCRGILANLLISTERKTEAEHLLREAIRNFPNNEVFRDMLDELSSPVEPQENRGAGVDSATEGRLAVPGQAGEQETGGDGGGSESAISAYLDRLTAQVPLLETYFAPSASAGDAGAMLETPSPDTAPRSEIELVAKHRAGWMEGSGREYLDTWVKARPSSYSARLLLAWRGREGNGLDRAAMSRISSDFPENRHWNEWLCYGFASGKERVRLRQNQEAMNGGDGSGKTFWWGRLSTVYPDLKTDGDGDEGGMSYDPIAMKRLLEDIAFAGADRTVPGIPIP